MRSLVPLLGVVLLPLGCASYQFGPPPQAPPSTAPPIERCVSEKRLSMSSASGTAQLLNETSSDGTYLYARGRSVSGDGYTFYRGQERLDVDDGLEELGDPALRDAHERAQSEVSGAHTRQIISRPLWITLIAAGVVASIVGISQLKGDDGKVDKTALAVTGAGLGAMLLATPLLYLDYSANADAAAYSLRKKIYMPSASDQARLPEALKAQHARAERGCAR